MTYTHHVRSVLFFSVWILGAAIFTFASPCAAEEAPDDDAFQAAVDEALEHYTARRYEEAIAAFERAFEIRQEPELVYNIGRSYERNLYRERAVEYYERFLTMPSTTAELRTRVLENLNALRAELAAMEHAAQLADPGTDPEPTPPTDPPPVDQGGRDLVVEPASERSISGIDVTGWVLVGIGVAALGTGTLFGGLTVQSNREFEEAGSMDDQLDLRDEVRFNAMVADIMFGAGAAVAIAGATILIVRAVRRRSSDEPETEQDPSLSVSPSVAPGALGITAVGHF